MGKLMLILIAVLSVSSASFMRPWENRTWVITNPNIWSYGAELWWNLPELHKTVQSLDLDGLENVPANGSALVHLQKAREGIIGSDELETLCIIHLQSSAQISLFSPAIAFFNYLARVPECLAYPGKWKSAVDSSLSAVDSSFLEADIAIRSANESYSSLVHSGLCGGDYAGAGSESCPELNSAFAGLQGGLKEGDFGKYSSAKQLADELKEDLRSPAPDMSKAKVILGIIWNEDGVIPAFNRLRDKSEAATEVAKSAFQSGYSSAFSKKASIDSMLAGLKKEELQLIDEGASGYSLKVGSIEERFSSARKARDSLAMRLVEAKETYSRTATGNYLADSLASVGSADKSFSALSDDLAVLESDAEDAVSRKRSEAEEEIRKSSEYVSVETPSPQSLSSLDEAKGLYENARSADSLGRRFSLYSDAAASAREARSTSLESQAASETGLAGLKDLISRAEKDRINVVAEKESLSLVSKLPGSHAGNAVAELLSSVEEKAKIKYKDLLLGKRKSLSDKIALAGPDAADLASEMERYEEGLVAGDEILFPEAIGSLAALESDYDALEGILEGYMREIVGNSMSASAITLVPEARLDSPSELIVDIVLSNARPYSTKNAEVKVSLDRPLQLIFSDIAGAKEDVQSVRMGDGGKTLIITYSDVLPYETKRTTFKKNITLARTISDSIEAEGIGDGRAAVIRRIKFETETAVRGISLPEDIGDPLIDGGPPDAPIPEGRHEIVSEYTLDDAYSESMHNIRAYQIGTNSQVEFDIHITPKVDLKKAPVFVSSLNSSLIRSMDLVSVSGEQIKNERRLSETQYGAEILGLKEGKTAILRVNYLVENTKQFVEEHLGILRSLNASGDAMALIIQAESESDSGNYTRALELIEKAKSLMASEEKKTQKAREEFSVLSSEIGDEISLITAALSGTALNGSFVQKLASRRSELQKALDESDGDIAVLEKADKNWLGKEITSLKKELYRQYNDLKERFFSSGYSSTPSGFLDFEQKLSELESGSRLSSAIGALEALENVRLIVESSEKDAAAEKEILKSRFDISKSGLLDSWDRYSKQASAAKGTEYSSLFTESERKIHALIDDAEASLEKDPRLLDQKLEDMDQARQRLDDTLASLAEQAQSRAAMLASLIEGRPELSERLLDVEAMAESGEYVNSLRAASSLSKEIDSKEKPDDGLLVIGITAIAILAGTGFYMMKKPKKELRKLNEWKKPKAPL